MRVFLIPVLLCVQILAAQTPSLQRIPGTKISMVAPDGFDVATTFAGFQQESSGSSILVIEIKSPYIQMAKAFTENPNQKKPFDILGIDSLNFQNFPALWLTLRQEAYGDVFLKKVLLFGDDSISVMIQGIFPEELRYMDSSITKSLRSVVFDRNHHVDPFETLPFTIDPEQFGFELRNVMSGILTYTLEESPMPQLDEQTNKKITTPLLLIAPSMGKVMIGDKKEYAIQRFKNLPKHKSYTIHEVNSVIVDSLDGYEILAKSADKVRLSYMVLLFTSPDGYVLLSGDAETHHEEMINRYRKVLKTFRTK